MQCSNLPRSSFKIISSLFLVLWLFLLFGCGKEEGFSQRSEVKPTPMPLLEPELSSEDNLSEHKEQILAHFETAEFKTFVGAEEIPISTYFLPSGRDENGDKGTIVFLPGRAESVKAFAELIFDLNRQGYSVYAMDHRGQGKSGRMTTNSQTGYVDQFDHYVVDFKTFISKIVLNKKAKKRYLLTHSMGGAVAALYLHDQPSAVFDGIVMSAPMFQLNVASVGESAALMAAKAEIFIGNGKSYALTTGDTDLRIQFTDEANYLTQSKSRMDFKMDLYRSEPSLTTGGPSYQWIYEAILATRQIRQAKFSSAMTTPMLILQAAEDKIVAPEAQTEFCGLAPHCRLLIFADSYHSILMEQDKIRNKALKAALGFFSGQ